VSQPAFDPPGTNKPNVFFSPAILPSQNIISSNEKAIELKEIKVFSAYPKSFENDIYSTLMDKIYRVDQQTLRKYNNLTDLLTGEFYIIFGRDSTGNLTAKMPRGEISLRGDVQP